jgi:hypothetical protein
MLACEAGELTGTTALLGEEMTTDSLALDLDFRFASVLSNNLLGCFGGEVGVDVCSAEDCLGSEPEAETRVIGEAGRSSRGDVGALSKEGSLRTPVTGVSCKALSRRIAKDRAADVATADEGRSICGAESPKADSRFAGGGV